MEIVFGAMLLKRGCEESLFNKKGGWDICGIEVGVGVVVGVFKINFNRKLILGKFCSYFKYRLKKEF